MKLRRAPSGRFDFKGRDIPSCVQRLIDMGRTRDEAEDQCRGLEPATIYPGSNNKAFPLRGEARVAENNAVSMLGPGMYSGYGELGTGTVSFPDAAQSAKAFRKGLGKRGIVDTDRAAWQEYAKRLSMMPDDIEKGWNLLSRGRAEEAIDAVFGESTAWGGYYIPNPGMMAISQPEAPVDGQGGGGGSGGTGFPFRTASAEKVFREASRLILLYPELSPSEILRMAVEKSGVSQVELTPEDEQLLLISVQWLQTGPARTDIRIGGTPGGPFNSTDRSGGTP